MNNTFKLIFISFLLLLPFTTLAANFNDVPESHPNFAAIEALEQLDVVNGYGDGTFKPDNKINRAEALKMILLAGGVYISNSNDGGDFYSDVDQNAWFYNYVNTATSKKIVKGYEDETFKPGNNVNLAEALKMSFQSYDIANAPTDFEDPYPDVPKEWWFAPYASFTASKNITIPGNDGLLHAEKEVTRAELAELLYRFNYTSDHNLDPFPKQFDGYKLIEAAREQIGVVTKYDTSYYSGGYPPDDSGACTDVIEHALRDIGYELKKKLDTDMVRNSSRYPHTSDPNINYRRVVNVKVYFDYYAESLSTCTDDECFKQGIWQPGDIVTYNQMEGGLWHIAIISDKTSGNVPLLIHNYGRGVTEDNLLLTWPATISGHYRIPEIN